jgi:hypothetical protein
METLYCWEWTAAQLLGLEKKKMLMEPRGEPQLRSCPGQSCELVQSTSSELPIARDRVEGGQLPVAECSTA